MAEKDARTYIRVHDGMPDHPKVEPLSDAAFRLLVTTWCWSSRYLTDGHVSATVKSKRGKAKLWAELVSAGLADAHEDGSLTMHHYTGHQRTADEVRTIQAGKAAAGSLGNHKRWHVDRSITDPECDHCCDRKPIADAIANGSRNVAIDIDTVKEKTPAGDPADLIAVEAPGPDPFDAWWKLYPKKKDKPQARAAYAAALKKPGVNPPLLLAALQKQLPSMTDIQFVIYPERWLKRERWADEAEAPSAPVKTYWTPEAPPREIADDPPAYSAWWAEQQAARSRGEAS